MANGRSQAAARLYKKCKRRPGAARLTEDSPIGFIFHEGLGFVEAGMAVLARSFAVRALAVAFFLGGTAVGVAAEENPAIEMNQKLDCCGLI